MSFLWIAFGLILRIDIGVDHTRSRPRMIRRCTPGTLRYSHPAEFLQRNTTPVRRRAQRVESAPAVATVLVAEYTKLSLPISAQPVRTK